VLLNTNDDRKAVPGLRAGDSVLPLGMAIKTAGKNPGFALGSTTDALGSWSNAAQVLHVDGRAALIASG
jgi:hypothetical protein